MYDNQKTLKDCLIEAGLWSEGDGELGTDERSYSIALQRIDQQLAKGVFLIFRKTGEMTHEARIIGCGNEEAIATGKTLTDAICHTVLSLPNFLRNFPECAASPKGA